MIRIGIVGARRNAQGIGEYVARDLAAAGADVRAVVGTSNATCREACDNLKKRFDLDVCGYTDLDTMIEAEQLQAIAICSPYPFHAEHLEIAGRHRLHVLCEKPFLFDPNRDTTFDAETLVNRFADQQRVLMVNQQWPYTLTTFDQCYPGVRAEPMTRLQLLLAPAEDGIGMIPNAMPHVLSLLFASVPTSGSLESIRIDQAPGRMEIGFDYVHAAGRVAVDTTLVQAPSQPRPAGYAINGSAVWRVIQLAGYQMFLARTEGELTEQGWRAEQHLSHGDAPSRLIALEDPLRKLADDFIRCVVTARPRTVPDPTLVENVRSVQQIYDAARNFQGHDTLGHDM